MRAVIYYFSATGNSLVVARDLANELNGADVIPITKAINTVREVPYDLVGIVYPVYMFGVPLIVAEFLKKIVVRKNSYVFSVATFDGLSGRAHSMAREILKKRGIGLSLGFSVLMPGNYTPLYGAISKEKQDGMFTNEKAKVQEIARYVREHRRGVMEEKPFLINFLLYTLLYRGGSSQIPRAVKHFWVCASCTRCGLCAKVCPVANIQLCNGSPVWLGHCQHCMACLQWCPVESIQFKKSTVGRKRYHHPAVTPQDIMAQR